MAKSTRKAASPRKPQGARVIVRQRLGRKPPPPNESKRDRFCRIGERRMTEIVSKIALLGNLSGSQYECTQADIDNMRETVQNALDIAMSRFAPRTRESTTRFRFGQDGQQRGMH